MARSTALRQHVRDACRALKFPENEQLSKVTLRHLIYDDAHQAVYCYIPKVREARRLFPSPGPFLGCVWTWLLYPETQVQCNTWIITV